MANSPSDLEERKCWKEAKGCFVPKEKNSKTINQFKKISLLNVEWKMFMAVLAKRISGYSVESSIETYIQKAGIPGFPGWVKHTNVISHLIDEAKEEKKSLATVW